MKRFQIAAFLGLVAVAPMVTHAQDANAIDDEYRVTLFPYHRLSDKVTGFGYLGYVKNSDKGYTTDYLGYGLSYTQSPVVQWWGGLIHMGTDNDASADKEEWRPFVGLKLSLANDRKWNVYNYTRYEYRSITNQDTNDTTVTNRIRNRIGVEVPLGRRERAWQPHTWYALADIEAFYRFDKDTVDPFRWRAGIAYVASNRLRLELIYHAQYTRPNDGLEYTDNIYRLNIKIALNRGMLQKVFDGADADD